MACTPSCERGRRHNLKGFQDVCLENGSSQGQKLVLTVLYLALTVLYLALTVL